MNTTSRTTAAVLPALMFIATALLAQQAAPRAVGAGKLCKVSKPANVVGRFAPARRRQGIEI